MKLFATIFAVALTCAASLHASDLRPDSVRVPLASEHVNSDADLNEINPGLALTWEGNWVDVTAGFVRNSFDNNAPFLTISRDIWANDICSVAGFIGSARYTELMDKTDVHLNGWIPIGGAHAECGPVFLQAMPGRGIVGQASGPKAADAILVVGITMDFE
ncbi:hypothetical protein [Yoonia sp. BS5-3]|uniref:Uncharacterized protein n=1 Tax=Yoonia phaeophyticola TaxID=3137369 RepID=A0ABZ2UZW6_9RHOB